MRDAFRIFAKAAADAVGSPAAFLLGVLVTVFWAATGPYFHYSDTWQLVINTGTSIGTFLIVFLIQNTQNRDSKVMQLKLDELIRAVQAARTELVQMEDLTDEELDALQKEGGEQSGAHRGLAAATPIAADSARLDSDRIGIGRADDIGRGILRQSGGQLRLRFARLRIGRRQFRIGI
jgi:low affinity Fe/Cu permease